MTAMRVSESPRRPRVRLRQIGLFVVSIVVPSAALVGVGLGMLAQQDELADKHAADERHLRAAAIERALSARLESLRQRTDDPAVAIVATFANTELRLPWEGPVRSAPSDPAVRTAILDAEREQFAAGQLDRAERLLRRAMERTRTGDDLAYLSLRLGRVLSKQHEQAEALREYHQLLNVSMDVADDS